MKASRLTRLGAAVALLSLAAVLMTGAASGGASTSKDGGVDRALLQQLIEQAQGSVKISEEDATKMLAFIRAGQNGDLFDDDDDGSASKKVEKFLAKYGALLGAGGESTLQRESVKVDRLGGTHIRYEQSYKGVPVWGGELVVHVDADNDVTAVNGTAIPELNIDVTPRLSADEAISRAIAMVSADPPTDMDSGAEKDVSVVTLKGDATLYIYRLGLVKNETGSNQLVYEVEVTNGADIRDFVFVGAHSGKIVNRYSAIHDGLDRRLFEAGGTAANPTFTLVWKEGDPFPGTLNAGQQDLVNYSGDSYRFFWNAFGRDSYDGQGHTMTTVNNDPRINCPNANWNGVTTNYCTGTTSDDVVAHEWGHAYTEYTSNLIYQWQPGALNESYSDIWGEVVDILNNAGTDSPGGARSDGVCSQYTAARPLLTINSPAAIAGDCPTAGANFGPALDGTGVTGNVVLANDGVGNPSDGCTTPFVNAAAVAGKVALIDRGTCQFSVKVYNAQQNGAVAVIVANNVSGSPFTMGAGANAALVTIPSVMTSIDHGNLMKTQLGLNETVNVFMRDAGGTRENSYRWLMGEDAFAFGLPGRTAIRDMWNPRCLQDPGKVTDAEYHCNTSDAGGVHSNSGVPNHGFALLVDGGTYNGHTINALGLVKAAHIYWRAGAVYQTKTSDFPDHADALEASCTDLIGQNLEGLATGPVPAGPSGMFITAADCGEVTKTIAAIELRHDPSAQCNFTPMLNLNAPKACGPNSESETVYKANFEGKNGLKGWTVSNSVVYPGASIVDWRVRNDLPGDRKGSAVFAEDMEGQCDGSANDRSGVMRLTSPVIKIEADDETGSLRLVFDHYVATEFLWDGGNVKLSVNGGAFAVVPATAFVFNPYNATMNPAAAGNTNPLAGQPGFTGTDGGKVTGSWAQSQIDLGLLGVAAGDRIQLSFEFGMDGCGAIDGWYVDDVKVVACELDDDDDDDDDDDEGRRDD